MLRNTGNTDAIIIEYGFLDSTKDDVNQLKNNWQEYAEAAVEAIAEYLNLPYGNNTSNIYTVKSGDSLWSIAKKFNTTVNELKMLNNLTSNLLTIGQQLKIPSSNSNEYTVKAGDTIYSIAQKYNLTVDKLKDLNGLTSNMLKIGQVLNVTPNNNPNDTYTVKSGDTLYSIAQKYNLTVNELKQLNGLTNNLLTVGQILKVSLNNNEFNTYTVKDGDTLYSIANLYNTTINNLKVLNNLTNDLLTVGQILKVPNY